jgi:hypothetical protein
LSDSHISPSNHGEIVPAMVRGEPLLPFCVSHRGCGEAIRAHPADEA